MQPLIIAHRGASALAPENTMAAFRLAKQLNADGIELDVQLSADNKLVVIHDRKLDRTTNGQGEVDKLAWSEMKNLDAGSKFGDQFQNERLPLLEEVFEELGGKLLINVELKNLDTPYNGLTEPVVKLIKQMNLIDSVILSSFNDNNLLEAKSLEPSIGRGFLTIPGFVGAPDRRANGRRLQFTAIHPYFKDVTPRLVRRFHNRGMQVNVWTVNEDKDLLKMKALGVDMIICNDPKHAREVIEAA